MNLKMNYESLKSAAHKQATTNLITEFVSKDYVSGSAFNEASDALKWLNNFTLHQTLKILKCSLSLHIPVILQISSQAFQRNLNHRIWPPNAKVMAKTILQAIIKQYNFDVLSNPPCTVYWQCDLYSKVRSWGQNSRASYFGHEIILVG